MFVCAVEVINCVDNQSKYWYITEIHQAGGPIQNLVNYLLYLSPI